MDLHSLCRVDDVTFWVKETKLLTNSGTISAQHKDIDQTIKEVSVLFTKHLVAGLGSSQSELQKIWAQLVCILPLEVGGEGVQLFPSAQSVNIYSVFQHTSNWRIQWFLYQFLHTEQKKQVLKMEVIAFAWHTEPGLHIKPEMLVLCQVHGEGKNKWPSQPMIHPIKWLEICPVRTRNQKIK